jgi:hypothetical protein
MLPGTQGSNEQIIPLLSTWAQDELRKRDRVGSENVVGRQLNVEKRR